MTGFLIALAALAPALEAEPFQPGVGLALSGNLAVVTHHKGVRGVSCLDVSDPHAPKLVGTLKLEDYPQAVAVDGSSAYVADGKHLVTVDVSNPAEPRKVADLAVAGDAAHGPQDVAVAGRRAYLACRADGLRVVDLDKGAILSQVPTSNYARGVAVAGDTVYVADSKGLAVVRGGKVVGYADTVGCAEKVVVRGHVAYVATGKYGVEAFDVSDPAKPVPRGKWADLSNWYGSYVAAADEAAGKVYVADGEGGIEIVDFEDTAAPKLIAEYWKAIGKVAWQGGGTSLSHKTIIARGKYAYVGDSTFGLVVYDVADPIRVRLAGSSEDLAILLRGN